MNNNKTVGVITSRLINAVKEHNSDSRLSRRYVWNVFKTALDVFIKRENDKNKLQLLSDVWQTICVPMEQVSALQCECLSIDLDCTINRSKNKLPKITASTFGPIIDKVTNVTNSIRFDTTTANSYDRQRKIKYNNSFYYFIEDDYLWLPNSDIEAVRLRAYFSENVDKYKCNYNPEDDDACKSKLEEIISAPDYLITAAIKVSLIELLEGSKQITWDSLPNKNNNPEIK